MDGGEAAEDGTSHLREAEESLKMLNSMKPMRLMK